MSNASLGKLSKVLVSVKVAVPADAVDIPTDSEWAVPVDEDVHANYTAQDEDPDGYPREVLVLVQQLNSEVRSCAHIICLVRTSRNAMIEFNSCCCLSRQIGRLFLFMERNAETINSHIS
jgi:hypothetical protein